MLAFAACDIDALSYLGLNRVFTANMTGNTVLLGIALAELDGDAIRRSILALAGFLAGAAAGAWIVERDHSDCLWPWSVTFFALDVPVGPPVRICRWLVLRT